MKKDHDFKERTLEEAKAFKDNPLMFAKTCITLVEAIRKNMGPVDLQYAGNADVHTFFRPDFALHT